MNYKIFIDPRCQILYASYYIVGLYEKYGEQNVKFKSSYFKTLPYKGRIDYDQFFAFVVLEEASQKTIRVVVDYGDQNYIRENAYSWTDVYAKINISKDSKIVKEKLISIPPSFGVNIWEKHFNKYMAISNFVKCLFTRPVSVKTFLGSYKASEHRERIEVYTKPVITENDNYVFFVSSLWTHQECIELTNPLRYTYMKAVKENVEIFEGGFVSNIRNEESDKYKDMLYQKFINPIEYVSKIKKSLFVFNTPAVHNCHGWKLGEYLAMGQAIISTPLSNKLPIDLRNNDDIIIVHNSTEIESAIIKLKDKNFRARLHTNAKAYYNNYASPTAVVTLIINSARHEY